MSKNAILSLVERFENHKAEYTSGVYNETQLRRDFLDPFFEALGWDVFNQKGWSEAFREVIHEDALQVEGSNRAPDYCFRLGGRRVFFVEAKKPSVSIRDDVHPAYQLRRYAWSAKLPVSILTDFQELAVYDCRIKPAPTDKASTARVMYLTFDQFPAQWEALTALFSPEAIQKGALEKFVGSAKLKRGTALVDDAFLEEIEGWREILAKSIALRNPNLSTRDLNFTVQRTIDRVIFLRICEDRGIETYATLRDFQNGANIYERLVQYFRQADDRYNSGLFHFRDEKDQSEAPDTLTPRIKIDDKPLKDILKSLYYPECPYEFSVLGADILGSVYERFLGKVIRLTAGHRAVVEDKPEVRKAGGVFYTPTYIVDYIVKNTVGKLLEGKTPRQVSELRFLDLACGSGSFLIGAFQYLLDWHLEQYVKDPEKWAKGKDQALYQSHERAWKLTTQERKRILLNNIYGVDIDSQAVEVTKLSLLLKVLEGESGETISKQLKLFHERALPDLGSNIKCGNSLIGLDFYQQQSMADLTDEDHYLINVFDWSQAFPEILKRGGFDAIIGNPPYGAEYTDIQKEYFQANYVYKKGKPETYIYFLEKASRMLVADGIFGFITPNAWLTNYYGVQLRKHLLESGEFQVLVDLEPTKVFAEAVVDTVLTIFKKAVRNKKKLFVEIFRGTKDKNIEFCFKALQSNWMRDTENVINLSASPDEAVLLNSLENIGAKIGDFAEYSQGVIPYKTKEDGANNLYISSERKSAEWSPLLENASQVKRYLVIKPKAFIKYGPWLWCAREDKYFKQPKILFHRLRKKMPQQLIAAIDTTGVINRHSLSNMILKYGKKEDLLYAILGLLNSRLGNWWFVKKYGLLMEVGGFKLSKFPLPQKFDSAYQELAKSVKRRIDIQIFPENQDSPNHRIMFQHKIDATDRQIDQLVYELYCLTDNEIRIVEGSHE